MTLPYRFSSVRNHSLLLKTSHLCTPRSALGCFSPKESPFFKKNTAQFLSPQKHTSLPLKLVSPLASFSSYADAEGDEQHHTDNQQIQNSHESSTDSSESDGKDNAEATGDFSGMAQAFHISSTTARAISIVIAFSALTLPLFMKSLGQGLALKTKLLSYATLLFGFYMAWNIGANDVANAMGTSVGSGALTIRQAVMTAAVLEFSGALLMGTHVTSTMQKGILMANVFQGKDMLLFSGLLSSLAAAGTWLQVPSYLLLLLPNYFQDKIW